MSERRYSRFCPVASTLDIVGERWTLLIVNELLIAPRRYGELSRSLPGMGSNILAERLRKLEGAGIVRRTALAGPGSGVVYELTDNGRALGAVILELRRWGTGLLTVTSPTGDRYDMSYVVPPDAAATVDETYQWEIDGTVFHLRFIGTELLKRPGPAENPSVILRASLDTMRRLATGELSEAEARRTKLLVFEGTEEAFDRMQGLLGDPSRRALL